MKYIFAIIMTVMMSILLINTLLAAFNKKPIAKSVRNLLFAGSISAFLNVITVLTNKELTANIAYGIFFASIDWLLCAFLSFCIKYGGLSSKHIKRWALWILVGLDSLSLILNPITGHAFEVYSYVMPDGYSCYKFRAFLFFDLHLTLSYIIVFAIVIVLVYLIITKPNLYKIKYIAVMLTLLVIVGFNAVYLFMDDAIDFSVIGYGFAGICIYFVSLVFLPKKLLQGTLMQSVEEMNDAMVIFDMDGICVYANDITNRFIDIKIGNNYDSCALLKKWCNEQALEEVKSFVLNTSMMKEDDKIYIRIDYRQILDKTGRFQGGSFMIQDRTEAVESQAIERYFATHDRLTGLYNKEYFYEKSKLILKQNPNIEYLIVCSDVRNFKLVNDVFGKETGDEVLIRMSHALREHAKEGSVYARLSNDRFAVLMPKSRYSEQLFINGPREAAYVDSDLSYPIQIYVGVYDVENRDIPISVMCDRAFMAISTIKDNADKRIAYYDDSLRKAVLVEQELSGELHNAISKGQICLYLQPQMDSDGNVLGAEALVRWNHPIKGMVMPNSFIPIFEKNGMIAKLDKYCWECACKQLAKWKSIGREDLYISVNISPKDFYFLDIYSIFTELVKKYEIKPENIKLEITETAVMMNHKRQIDLIDRLRSSGFVVEMDDFGSGYSSLNMLKDIKVDILKIDMAFLGFTEDNERSRKILEMVIGLSKQLDMPVVAEGVETLEQVNMLRSMGCDIYQGYYYSRPIPIEEFESRYV